MINFKLKTGEIVLLELVRQNNDNIYNLVDENDIVKMILQYKNNEFSIIDSKDVLENDDSLHVKLDNLARIVNEEEFNGIENESESESIEENDPFNPEEISIDTKLMTMETCLRRLEQGTLKLNPDFQRQEVWTDDKKSQLIESLMLKIPIPMFYVSSDEKSNLTVVDGLQRLSTIRDFILGKKYLETKNIAYKGDGFKLKNLEFWKNFDGSKLNMLPIHIYNRIMETEFTFTIINPGTPEEVRRNIFKRLNTGGMPLSSQEIRNALYTGKATEFLKILSKKNEFTKATCGSIKSERMEDKELILRFVSFVIRDYSTYKKTINVDTWLSNTMIIINTMPEFDSREFKKVIKAGSIDKETINSVNLEFIEDQFIFAMKRASDFFGEHAFRKSYPGIRRTPINKSLFETWGILLCNISNDEFLRLKKCKKDFMEEYKKIIADPNFVISISRDSMKHPAVKFRFNILLGLLNKYIY